VNPEYSILPSDENQILIKFPTMTSLGMLCPLKVNISSEERQLESKQDKTCKKSLFVSVSNCVKDSNIAEYPTGDIIQMQSMLPPYRPTPSERIPDELNSVLPLPGQLSDRIVWMLEIHNSNLNFHVDSIFLKIKYKPKKIDLYEVNVFSGPEPP
jgi:hypothetical protein